MQRKSCFSSASIWQQSRRLFCFHDSASVRKPRAWIKIEGASNSDGRHRDNSPYGCKFYYQTKRSGARTFLSATVRSRPKGAQREKACNQWRNSVLTPLCVPRSRSLSWAESAATPLPQQTCKTEELILVTCVRLALSRRDLTGRATASTFLDKESERWRFDY